MTFHILVLGIVIPTDSYFSEGLKHVETTNQNGISIEFVFPIVDTAGLLLSSPPSAWMARCPAPKQQLRGLRGLLDPARVVTWETCSDRNDSEPNEMDLDSWDHPSWEFYSMEKMEQIWKDMETNWMWFFLSVYSHFLLMCGDNSNGDNQPISGYWDAGPDTVCCWWSQKGWSVAHKHQGLYKFGG